VAIDEQSRQLEIEDRVLDEQQKRIQISSAKDDKPPLLTAISKIKAKKAVEIIDLTED